jgi:hypothetical protein
VITSILWAALCFAFPPLFVLAAWRPSTSTRFFARWAYGGAGGMTTSAIAASFSGGWPDVAAWGASGLLGLILWWWSRRKRRRSLRQLGGKARARLAAMLRNMPRPSPRLVPQRVPA